MKILESSSEQQVQSPEVGIRKARKAGIRVSRNGGTHEEFQHGRRCHHKLVQGGRGEKYCLRNSRKVSRWREYGSVS